MGLTLGAVGLRLVRRRAGEGYLFLKMWCILLLRVTMIGMLFCIN